MEGSVLLSTIGSDHVRRVQDLVDTWSRTNGQVRLLTEDGESVWCGRLFLVMYSRMLRDLLVLEDRSLVSISLPVSSSEMAKVLELLQTGVVAASSQEECDSLAAVLVELLGIDMEHLVVEENKPFKEKMKITGKKRKPRKPRKTKIKKEEVEVKLEEVEAEIFFCETCPQTFQSRNDLRKHMYEHTGSGIRFECPECNSTFGRRDKFNFHFRTKHEHGGIAFPCNFCDKLLSRKDKVREHVRRKHPGQL